MAQNASYGQNGSCSYVTAILFQTFQVNNHMRILMIVCLAQTQLQRAQLVLHTYQCRFNQRLERRRLRIRIKLVSLRHVNREAQARSTKRVFHNPEMAHIKFDSSMQN